MNDPSKRRKAELLVLGAATALSVFALAFAARASETINYSYDARGQLVAVSHSGTVNNNVFANYSYDKADNRTNKNVTGAP